MLDGSNLGNGLGYGIGNVAQPMSNNLGFGLRTQIVNGGKNEKQGLG